MELRFEEALHFQMATRKYDLQSKPDKKGRDLYGRCQSADGSDALAREVTHVD